MAQDPALTQSDNPAVIARDIRETRADMSETVDALADKLDPDRLKDQAADAITGAAHDLVDKAKHAFTGGGDGNDGGPSFLDQVQRSSAFDAVKENPLPALAVGLSLAWFVSKLGESEQERYRAERFHATGDPYYAPRGRAYLDEAYQSYPAYGSAGRYRGGQDPQGYGEPARVGATGGLSAVTGTDASLGDKASDALDTAQDKASDLAAQAKSAVSSAADSAKDMASDAADAVTGTAGSLSGDAQRHADDAHHRAAQMQRRSASWMDRQMQQNPLLVGAVSLAAGAVVGLSLPQTDLEEDLMGDQAAQLRQQAKHQALAAADAASGTIADSASTVADEAKAAVEDVTDTAKEKADEVASKAKAEAGDVAEKAERKAKSTAKTAKAETKAKASATPTPSTSTSRGSAKTQSSASKTKRP